MSIIVGADIGRSNTKIYAGEDNKICFRTCVDIQNNSFESSVITFNDDKYLVGEIGNDISDTNKSNDEVFPICLLYGLNAIQADEEEKAKGFDIVFGLSVNDYHKYKNKFKEKFENKKFEILDSNDIKKTIKINNVEVAPEAVLYSKEEKGNILIIDIGGLTVDVSLVKRGKVVKSTSLEKGVKKLYKKIAEEMFLKHDVSFNIHDVEDALRDGIYVVEGREIPINTDVDFDRIRLRWLNSIVGEIRGEFEWEKSIRKFIGGGALVFKDFLERPATKDKIKIDKDSVFANAKAFYKLGEKDYGKHK